MNFFYQAHLLSPTGAEPIAINGNVTADSWEAAEQAVRAKVKADFGLESDIRLLQKV